MEYFKVLNLEREPFSNSPEPELFFPSRNHVECLQMLEMAIRLRRGLNVVLGEVGTGKTTLCRKLIQQLSAEEDRGRVEVHLVLDPSFSTVEEFLAAITGFFGIVLPEASPTERQLKEAIKACLFTKGVDEGKTVVLLVDEGQKLPGFCLEILRELLNYETNDSKLLQIAIFAQTEFEQTIRHSANFTDRINLCCRLHPLNLRETGRMIRYRIEQAGGRGATQRMFSWPAMYAVYRVTGGYPRAINMLCHHVVLAMIIQNRVRAGRSLVRASAGRLALLRPAPRGVSMAIAAVLLAVSLSMLALAIRTSALTGVEAGATKTAAVPAVAAMMPDRPQVTAPRLATVAGGAAAPLPKESRRRTGAPILLGRLPFDREKNAWSNFVDLYASADADLFRVFKQANPHIDGGGWGGDGALANIPAIPSLSTGALMRKSCCIRIAQRTRLNDAYKLFRSFTAQKDGVHVTLSPYWSSREGLVFVLLLAERFPDRASAEEAQERLPASLRKDAGIIDGWDEDTVFYRGFGDEV